MATLRRSFGHTPLSSAKVAVAPKGHSGRRRDGTIDGCFESVSRRNPFVSDRCGYGTDPQVVAYLAQRSREQTPIYVGDADDWIETTNSNVQPLLLSGGPNSTRGSGQVVQAAFAEFGTGRSRLEGTNHLGGPSIRTIDGDRSCGLAESRLG